jgi:NAD-dependent dihydropyrimidine dehydrogenase PreA subunit
VNVTYVIMEQCLDVKDQSCVEACPVDCIHPGSSDPDFDQHRQLYIDPDVCIECGACEPVCPVSAIRQDSDVPDESKQYIQINADYYKR